MMMLTWGLLVVLAVVLGRARAERGRTPAG